MEMINALGRRKRAIARIFVTEGTGKITINKRELEDPAAVEAYFDRLEADGLMPDILVANASVQAKTPWASFPMDEARREV
ncbi:MAG: 30S ribosomal protein S9, partial [Alloprevotella sp.]|nr:30S ribosomal protein S9 [Alloprevotella sp.]